MTGSKLYIYISVIIFVIIFTLPAGAYNYSLGVKATFMQGCLFDKLPDFSQKTEVFIKMKRCLCMMDKFEGRYSEKQFMDLFSHAEKEYSWQKRELDDFVQEEMPGCI